MSYGNSKKIYALCCDINKNNVFYKSDKHTDIYVSLLKIGKKFLPRVGKY